MNHLALNKCIIFVFFSLLLEQTHRNARKNIIPQFYMLNYVK